MIFGVVLGTLAADVVTLVQMIDQGELAGFTYADIPYFMALLFRDSAYVGATVGNVLMGLLFAGLGVFGILRKAGLDAADKKFIRLS